MAYIGKKPEDSFRGLAYYNTFTGDGSTTAFDLANDAPDGGDNDVIVVVDNVRQEPGASKSYTLGNDGSGNFRRVTFNVAPVASAAIYVINPGRSSSLITVADNAITNAKLNSSAINSQTELAEQAADNDTLLLFDTSASALKKIQVSNVSPSKSSGTATGDGSTTAFTINSGRNVNDVLVVVNGIVMVPTTDYQISGTTLTFQGSAPASGAEIVFRYI